jgi:hypothetical protein
MNTEQVRRRRHAQQQESMTQFLWMISTATGLSGLTLNAVQYYGKPTWVDWVFSFLLLVVGGILFYGHKQLCRRNRASWHAEHTQVKYVSPPYQKFPISKTNPNDARTS